RAHAPGDRRPAAPPQRLFALDEAARLRGLREVQQPEPGVEPADRRAGPAGRFATFLMAIRRESVFAVEPHGARALSCRLASATGSRSATGGFAQCAPSAA